jgi:ligand-binding sensor domain-containing protein
MNLNRRAVANRKFLLALCIALFLLTTFAGSVYYRANRALETSRQLVEAEQNLGFTDRLFVPPADSGFEWVSAPAVFTEAAEFQGHLFVAGPAGLAEYDDRGHQLRNFRVGRELPSSPLIRVVATNPTPSLRDKHGAQGQNPTLLTGKGGLQELVIATADAGVLVFNGMQFRQILPESHDARAITTVLPVASGHLLIGTQRHGLLVYDGRRLQPFHPTLGQGYVTELAGTESDLWMGTADRGVAHWHGGSTEWFNESNGLPDARVYSIAVGGDKAFVGTATGIAEFDDGRFARVLAPGAFVRALLPQGKTLIAGTMDDGLIELPLEHALRGVSAGPGSSALSDVQQLTASGDTVYAIATNGIYSRDATGGWKRVLQPSAGLLSDRNVSALAMDRSGRLWVGFFDRGLDIVETNGLKTRHIEDEHMFCINRVLPDLAHGEAAVATANGLVLFDASGVPRQVLGRNEGLIAQHVTDVIPFRDGMAIATAAGLTFIDSAGTRSLYAFHGLVNNHVYTLAAHGHNLLAGTLGGATLLEDDQPRASYTTATSALKHNWITAAVSTGDEWWVGTYGAGVAKMDSGGKVESSGDASGTLIINPNAMLATQRFILAGTMGSGLYAMDRSSGRWRAITEGLPSRNVTALAAANGFVYVGTDNGLVRIREQRLGQ